MGKDQDNSKNNSKQQMNHRNNESNSSNSSQSSSSSSDSTNTEESVNVEQSSQQITTVMASRHPSIPNEIGSPNCPVCLSRVRDRAHTNTCLHEFCFPCIREWSQNHNQCPVCRERYTNILYNIRSSTEYDELPVAEPVNDGDTGILITNGHFGLIATPSTSGVYIINPMVTPHGMRYDMLFLAPNQAFIIANMNPGIIFATPQNLEQVLTQLHQQQLHRHHPHHVNHPLYLQFHRHNHSHRHNRDPNSQEQNPNQNDNESEQ